MARPKNLEVKNPDEELKKAGVTKDDNIIIFVGSGVVWGGKMNGNKPIARFDEYRLFKTSDQKIIAKMREEDYPEVTYDMLKSFIDAGTYFQSLSGLIKKKLPKNQAPGTFSESQIEEILS